MRDGVPLLAAGRARWTLTLIGVLLAGGAPAGLLAARAAARFLDVGLPLETLTLLYVGVATVIAFGAFGFFAGRLVDELTVARNTLAQQALQDSLTGLFNRRALFARLHDELLRARRTHAAVSLIMLDIDHFKAVNDRHGHPVGDAVLVEVATRIRQACRAIDTAARYGGEEFVVVAPGLDRDAAAQVAERIRASVERGVTHAGNTNVRVTISAGVAVASGTVSTESALVDAADRMLLLAKQSGRNRVLVMGMDA